jgi:hypothetical protein
MQVILQSFYVSFLYDNNVVYLTRSFDSLLAVAPLFLVDFTRARHSTDLRAGSPWDSSSLSLRNQDLPLPESEFLNLRSPRIDSKEPIPLGCVVFSLAGRYDNRIPTRFLVPMDCLKIPAQIIF